LTWAKKTVENGECKRTERKERGRETLIHAYTYLCTHTCTHREAREKKEDREKKRKMRWLSHYNKLNRQRERGRGKQAGAKGECERG